MPMRSSLPFALLLMLAASVTAEERFRFDEAKHGPAELRYIGNIPVVTVQGTPEEMGEQLGRLLTKPVHKLVAMEGRFRDSFGLKETKPVLFALSRLMLANFPEHHRRELKAFCEGAGVDHDLLAFGNIMYDMAKPAGCSTLVVKAERSATGEPIFGRNMDFPTFGFLDQFSVVTVYRPTDKHAFASIGFPGLLGCATAMNDVGLCVAMLEVRSAKDGSARFDPSGTPLLLCFRRIMEECTTVDEAEKLLNSLTRTCMGNLTVCDTRQAAVLEISTKQVVRRPTVGGAVACTNHFRTTPLSMDTDCWRYNSLIKSLTPRKLSVVDVGKAMHDVNQGETTIQTMVFEPKSLQLHIALGKGPVSDNPLEMLDLAELFKATMPAAETATGAE